MYMYMKFFNTTCSAILQFTQFNLKVHSLRLWLTILSIFVLNYSSLARAGILYSDIKKIAANSVITNGFGYDIKTCGKVADSELLNCVLKQTLMAPGSPTVPTDDSALIIDNLIFGYQDESQFCTLTVEVDVKKKVAKLSGWICINSMM